MGDTRNDYYIIIVREEGGDKRYERVGVGEVKAKHAFIECASGTL